ncbi:MAG TPA: glutaredoxin family protein, partial [Kofleriaceae bacterium]|nr:glutaredoxin family protein [Kofleriaceae bacterium]
MALDPQIKSKIDQLVAQDPVVLFMKGTRSFPQCGFSASVVNILNTLIPKYATVNVLSDPDVRGGMKEYSDWPTFPQLFIKGEFVGGA